MRRIVGIMGKVIISELKSDFYRVWRSGKRDCRKRGNYADKAGGNTILPFISRCI